MAVASWACAELLAAPPRANFSAVNASARYTTARPAAFARSEPLAVALDRPGDPLPMALASCQQPRATNASTINHRTTPPNGVAAIAPMAPDWSACWFPEPKAIRSASTPMTTCSTPETT